MSATAFISNEAYWQALTNSIKTARHVDAAIAYFGQGGAELLPLRDGDRLVVDMSSSTARAGGTDPREVERLIVRGVQAFTRRNLHAKVVVADKRVFAGSANVSRPARRVLDEAAVVTSDLAAVRRAREFIGRLCTEPVRPEYLERCKRIYRPPRRPGKRGKDEPAQPRADHAKLWIVNLREATVPEAEVARYELGEEKAKKLVKDQSASKTQHFHWDWKPKMADELDLGDWILQVTTYHDSSVIVSAPGQVLLTDHYIRDRASGKERCVFHLEVPRRSETMTWSRFCRATKAMLGLDSSSRPRTRPIRDAQIADDLLGLWTMSGKVSRR